MVVYSIVSEMHGHTNLTFLLAFIPYGGLRKVEKFETVQDTAFTYPEEDNLSGYKNKYAADG